VDFLRAEHGFPALIEVQVAGRQRRVLFDAGITPDGLIGNLDRLAIPPDTFEAIVLSNGHFHHVMGLDDLAARPTPRNLPILLHPDFCTPSPHRHPLRQRSPVLFLSSLAMDGGGQPGHGAMDCRSEVSRRSGPRPSDHLTA